MALLSPRLPTGPTSWRAATIVRFIIAASVALPPAAYPLADPPQVTQRCAGCHGPTGNSTDPTVPIIAGQSPIFIEYALKAYAAGVWPSTVMGPIAQALSEQQIKTAADHYSRQEMIRRHQSVDESKAKRGARIHARLCAKCHINGGRDYDEYEAILVGQWMPHLRKVLEQYRRGERAAEPMMLKKLDKLAPEDIEALVHYYGRGP